jgi:hypothetical protein
MRGLILSVFAVLLSANISSADIVATWRMNDGANTKLSIRDDQHVRIDTNEKDTYMLVKDLKVYMVRKEEGQWTAFDMDQMADMMKMFKRNQKPFNKTDFQEKYKDTGRFETIAGYKGKVFEVEYTDPNGQKKTDEIVLSKHKDVERIHKGWIVFASRMAQMLGQDSARNLDQSLKSAKMKGYGGMLRYGKDLILQRVEKPSLKISHYQLPPGTKMMDMPSMGKSGSYPTPPPAQQKPDDSIANKNKGSDSSSDKESQPSVVEGVRQGVKSIFKKVW